MVIAIVVISLLGYFGWKYRDLALLTVGSVGTFVLMTVLAAIFGKLVMQIVRFRQTLTKIAFGVGMSLFGFLIARLHLHVFNPLYLRLGAIQKANEGSAQSS